MDNPEVFPRVATATAMKAIEENVARLILTREEVFSLAREKIGRAQEQVRILMEKGIIPAPGNS